MKIQIGNTSSVYEILSALENQNVEDIDIFNRSYIQDLEKEEKMETQFSMKKEIVELVEVSVQELLLEETVAKLKPPYSYIEKNDIIRDALKKGFRPLSVEMAYELRQQYKDQEPMSCFYSVMEIMDTAGNKIQNKVAFYGNYHGERSIAWDCTIPQDQDWKGDEKFFLLKPKQSISE